MKKYILLVMISICLLSLVGCNDKNDNFENFTNAELSLGKTEKNYILADSYFVLE